MKHLFQFSHFLSYVNKILKSQFLSDTSSYSIFYIMSLAFMIYYVISFFSFAILNLLYFNFFFLFYGWKVTVNITHHINPFSLFFCQFYGYYHWVLIIFILMNNNNNNQHKSVSFMWFIETNYVKMTWRWFW